MLRQRVEEGSCRLHVRNCKTLCESVVDLRQTIPRIRCPALFQTQAHKAECYPKFPKQRPLLVRHGGAACPKQSSVAWMEPSAPCCRSNSPLTRSSSGKFQLLKGRLSAVATALLMISSALTICSSPAKASANASSNFG